MAEWWKDLFDERYFEFYASLASSQVADAEAAFIERALGLAPGSRILDLGCGQGRHAVALALRGHSVTGIDLSPFLLERARRLAAEHRANVTWLCRDMRDVPDLGPFDACVSMCTAFGYFTDDEDAHVLLAVRDAISPGGRILLDLDNPFPVLRRLPFDVWSESPAHVTHESITFDPLTSRRLTERIRHPAAGGRQAFPGSSVRLYYPHEIRRLLETTGFSADSLFGSTEDEPYDWRRSARMIWAATRSREP